MLFAVSRAYTTLALPSETWIRLFGCDSGVKPVPSNAPVNFHSRCALAIITALSCPTPTWSAWLLTCVHVSPLCCMIQLPCALGSTLHRLPSRPFGECASVG